MKIHSGLNELTRVNKHESIQYITNNKSLSAVEQTTYAENITPFNLL